MPKTQSSTTTTNSKKTKFRYRPTAEQRAKGNYQKPHPPYHPFQIGDRIQILHKYLDPTIKADHWGIVGTVIAISTHFYTIATEKFQNNTIIAGPTYRKNRQYLHPINLPPKHIRLRNYREHERFVAELDQKIRERNKLQNHHDDDESI